MDPFQKPVYPLKPFFILAQEGTLIFPNPVNLLTYVTQVKNNKTDYNLINYLI